MAQISSITLPDGTNYNLKGSIYTVIGTQTAKTGSWTGELKTLDALYDGLTIMYWLPRAGNGNATLNLTLKDDVTTGPIDCYYKTNTRLTTHYATGDIILMTYWSAGSVSIDGTNIATARWQAHGQYNTNSDTVPAVYVSTAAKTAAKGGTLTGASWANTTQPRYAMVDIYYANTAASALTLNVNSHGAKPIYINGEPSSSTNYTLPQGTYLAYFDGTYWDFRTDKILPTGGLIIDNKVNLLYNSTTDSLDFIFN